MTFLINLDIYKIVPSLTLLSLPSLALFCKPSSYFDYYANEPCPYFSQEGTSFYFTQRTVHTHTYTITTILYSGVKRFSMSYMNKERSK
jgi:hypothetical protein